MLLSGNSMKKRLALVRGPNLNAWEMQSFTPLLNTFDIVGFTSYGHNFDVSAIPFQVKRLFSFGQFLCPRTVRSSLSRLIGDYHDLQGLGDALRGFDIVHSAETFYYCTYQTARLRHSNRFKLVVTVWENIPFLYETAAKKAIKTSVFEAADLFLAVSSRAREALILEGVPDQKIRVQMPGIDLERFCPMAKDDQLLRRFGCSANDLIVLFVANLYREKGIFDLLCAFRCVLNHLGKDVKLKLLLAGRGRDESKVLESIGHLRLEDHARLIGSFPYSSVPQLHNIADIFVLPSIPIPTWQEQFGYVLVESMACGKPVISTMSGAISEVVADAGILVPPNDFLSLANALENLISDEKKRIELGQKGRRRAEEVFDSRRVAMQLKNHYETLLSNEWK
jgi:glycosyltransferase involved in cell wall biosynthesis